MLHSTALIPYTEREIGDSQRKYVYNTCVLTMRYPGWQCHSRVSPQRTIFFLPFSRVQCTASRRSPSGFKGLGWCQDKGANVVKSQRADVYTEGRKGRMSQEDGETLRTLLGHPV